MRNQTARALVVAFAAASLGAGVAATAADSVTGAGASFPAPLYAKWADAYNKATSNQINYQSVGSGAGIAQIKGKTVDFGASDMPLKDDELKQGGLMQFPTVVGGVVPVVHIAGVAAGALKLTGPVLADIYLGKIKKWDDAAIKELNPSLNLPSADVAVIHRADGSGTSFIFTNYLSKVNPEWESKVGAGTAPNWPTGIGGKGNEGVSAFVQRLPNAIGYVEYAYAKQNKMAYVQLKNAAGKFVEPTASAFAAAAGAADWSKSFYQVLTNQAGADAWPITGATFILMQTATEKPAQSAAALAFFDWSYANGDKMAAELDYIPLPANVKAAVHKAWGDIHDASNKLVYQQH
ncbi:MAG TPA: phosphate ABC transporter substrate-binding protein PstS [Burkholderiaceae bacterium]|nr:phosphate ABC transporter substrate-binding protein PstS [Burkholderiaceae bacterium]